ncbi:MAG TPA: phage virion morphogenesis protein [Methylophilaceae bacterium]|nr:phage virion morphogenesis protein [Methylophilaceae bacterium]
MYTTELDTSELDETFKAIINGAHDAAPLMRVISGTMQDEVEENFAQEGRPKWLGLKPETEAARKKTGHWPGKIMQVSGRLAASFEAFHDSNSAGTGTNVKYAAAQNYGVTTKAHIIRPRNKKALAFGGRVVKQVNHPGSVIPARPFAMITDAGSGIIEQHAKNYLAKIINSHT